MAWTDERIDTLKQLWEKGLTASQIAEQLGEVSRNAVIGKAHRLGLKARPSPVKSNDPDKKPQAASSTPSAQAASTGPAAQDAAVAGGASGAAATTAPEGTPEAAPDTGSQAADLSNMSSDGASADDAAAQEPKVAAKPQQKVVSIGPGGFMRQGPGDQQPPIPPAPPRRLVPAKPSPDIANKTGLLELNERVCRWPMGHPGEADFHFCGQDVNPGFPYCVEHCGRAYQAQLPRGSRRPPPPLPFGGPRVR